MRHNQNTGKRESQPTVKEGLILHSTKKQKNLHTLIIIMFVRTVLTATAPRMQQGQQHNHKHFFNHNCYKNA